MKRIVVSAPGKLMLWGEHAVVYGHPCIVTAVNQRIFATITKTSTEILEVECKDIGLDGYKKHMTHLGEGNIPQEARFVEIAVRNFKSVHPFSGGVNIKTKSEFSSLFGFGSSSASSVAVIKGLSELFSQKLSEKELFALAYQTVLDIQGRGSGFDVAAAIYGGTLFFQTGGKIIKPMKLKKIPLLVGYTGVKADTTKLMTKVATLAKKKPQMVDTIYNEIDDIVHEAHDAVVKSDWKQAGELMNKNQLLLKKLGVSSPIINTLNKAALSGGAWGSKLSGAGVGDCIIALIPQEKKDAISQLITQSGGRTLDVETNAPGVRVEKNI